MFYRNVTDTIHLLYFNGNILGVSDNEVPNFPIGEKDTAQEENTYILSQVDDVLHAYFYEKIDQKTDSFLYLNLIYDTYHTNFQDETVVDIFDKGQQRSKQVDGLYQDNDRVDDAN